MKPDAPTSHNGRAAVVLLSGGLDSATALAEARAAGYRTFALTIDYGQRHVVEVTAARAVASSQGVERHVVTGVDLRAFGGSALTDDIDVPEDRDPDDLGGDIPATYVPARNTVFLALALSWAEALGAADIFIGVNALDYSGYPDCRPEFIEAFEHLATVGTKAGVQDATRVKVHAPLVDMSKADIVRRGTELGVDFSLTVSCYQATPDGAACGRCDACILRRGGFEQAGVEDPTLYV